MFLARLVDIRNGERHLARVYKHFRPEWPAGTRALLYLLGDKLGASANRSPLQRCVWRHSQSMRAALCDRDLQR